MQLLRASLRVFAPSWWLFFLLSGAAQSADNWPQFRGPNGDGRSQATGLPTRWSETENVKWKTAIPGDGYSSPVVFGDQIWCTGALENGKSLHAICLDKRSGKIIHDVEVFHIANPEKKHDFNSYASPTPVIEAGRVYICFGNNGSACLDTATAKPIWISQELKLDHLNGPGSSPIVYKELYILCCDGSDVQYVAALDKNTGKLVWKTTRSVSFDGVPPDVRKAYNTPIVVRNEGRDQLLSIGAHRLYAYAVESGKELWYCDIPGFSNVAQPVFAEGMVYVSTGFAKADLWAVRADGAGDVTRTHIAWKFKKGVPCRSTPVVVGKGSDARIYMVSDTGIACCVKAESGEQLWQGRIGAGFSASPLYADGHVYFFDERGMSTVLQPGSTMQVISENTLDAGIMATPAISGKALFVRTKTHLYRVEK